MSVWLGSRLRRNATANVVQMVATAILLFLLYRFINTTLGVEQLGVWSVVLATVSASRLAELGLSGGVVFFVARDLARGETERAVRIVDTAAITLMVLVGAVLPLVFPLLRLLMPLVFDTQYTAQAVELIPYALVSLWLVVVGAVFQGALNGCERMELRAALVVVGQVIMVGVALFLVPRQGLVGLAVAQIVQGAVLLIGGRGILRKVLPGTGRVPRHWDRRVLREMLGYGANLQATTVAIMLFDPVAKTLMARFGGAAAAGYFEMANQIVLKVRALIVSANQAIVPHVAGLAARSSEGVRDFYVKNVRVLIWVTLPTMAVLISLAGVASWLLLGSFSSELVEMLFVVALGWSVNLLASAAYFVNMGSGQVGWNTVSHFVMGGLNLVLGWGLGVYFGAMGVVTGYAVSLVLGSALLVVRFQRRYRLGWSLWFPKEGRSLATASVLAVVAGLFLPMRIGSDSFSAPALIVAGVALLLVGLTAWLHPVGRSLLGRRDTATYER